MQFDLKGALKRALGGGLSGAAAMVLQVLLLMVCVPTGLSIVFSSYGDAQSLTSHSGFGPS